MIAYSGFRSARMPWCSPATPLTDMIVPSRTPPREDQESEHHEQRDGHRGDERKRRQADERSSTATAISILRMTMT